MATETLRPNAAGDETGLNTQYPDTGSHWDKVDEENADDDTTKVYNWEVESFQRDLYNLPASSGSGTINFIKIYFRVKRYGGYSGPDAKPSLKSNSTVTDGTAVTPSTSWGTFSQQWDTNPADDEAWEWADIDALQIGVSLQAPGTSSDATQCTQVYVEIDYEAAAATPQAVGGGSITPIGVLGLKTKISIGAGAITPTGALNRLTKIITGAGSITPSGALGRLIKIAVGAGNITPTGALSTVKRFAQAVGSGAVSIAGTLGRKIAIGVGSGAITPAATLGRKISISVGSGAVTIAGALNRLTKLTVGQGAVAISGALNRLIKITVGQGAIAAAGVLNRLIRLSVGQGAITPIGALFRKIFSLREITSATKRSLQGFSNVRSIASALERTLQEFTNFRRIE